MNKLIAGLVLVLVASATIAVAAGAGDSSLKTESAGTAESVVGARCEEGVAGVVVWPLQLLSEESSSRGGTVVAARALLEQVLGPYTEAEYIVQPTVEGLAVGVELPAGQQDQLLEILSRLAQAEDPPPEAVREALQQARERAKARAEDPLEQARLAALSSLVPGPHGPWLAEGTHLTLAELDSPRVYRLLAEVRTRPLQARVCGPSGLAARVARRLEGRLGAPTPIPALSVADATQSRELVVYNEAVEASPVAALVLAARIDEAQAHQAGAGISLLVEALRAGEGSLAQRLGVSLETAGDVWLETIWLPGTGGVVVLGTRFDSRQAESAWSLVSGTVSSVQNQLFRKDAVLRARQRLDRRAASLPRDAAAKQMVSGLPRTPWAWPPPDRWKAPIRAERLRETAVWLFAPERRAAALAGSSLLQETGGSLASWERIPAGAFCPAEEKMHCPSRLATALGRAGDVHSLARSVLRQLGVEDKTRARQAFRAVYQVKELTPGGELELELEVESTEKQAAVTWRGPDWNLRAESADDGTELRVNGEQAREVPRAALDRVEAYASREPVVFASAVTAGLLPAQASIAQCPRAEGCPAIRATLPEGSTLMLILDPSTGMPIETRAWWAADPATSEPDEVYRYRAWEVIDGVRVASELTVWPLGGAQQQLKLLRWQWP